MAKMNLVPIVCCVVLGLPHLAAVKLYWPSQFEYLKDCRESVPLGLISGEVQDWQISASSTYPKDWDKACNEKYARVYQPNGLAWCAKHKSASEWVQVDLGVPAKVTGIMTQGRSDGIEWVMSYLVSHSLDSYHWQYVTDQYGNQRVFEGNTDSFNVKHAYLDEAIIARYVKLHTLTWNRHPSMRFEIVGCQVCKSPLALPPYAKISASSEKSDSSSCQAEDGFLLTHKGWCAKENNNNQWLQFDIGPPTVVTGLVTRGRGESGTKQWVSRFRVSYSNDTSLWYFYQDSTHLDAKEFGANSDKDRVRYHFLSSPFVARYVRFHPIEWNKQIALRAGIIGCTFQGDCGQGFLRVVDSTPCVANMAYQKSSWINNKRHYKRHIRNQWQRGHAARAVDGDVTGSTENCTILDNFYVDRPTWMVDLGRKVRVSGVKIITWSNQEQTSTLGVQRDHVVNLDKLTVYVDNKGGRSQVDLPANVCGSISRFNDAIFRPTLHIQCASPLMGRYVYIEAAGVATRWTRLFTAALCEVMVYQ